MRKGFFFIIALALAWLLTIVMPQWGEPLYNPPWLLMVVAACMIHHVKFVVFSGPFLLGIVVDVMLGAPFGAHALSMLLPVTVLALIGEGVHCYSLGQQTLLVGLLSLLYQCVLVLIYSFVGMSPVSYQYFLSPVVAMIVWVLIFLPCNLREITQGAVD